MAITNTINLGNKKIFIVDSDPTLGLAAVQGCLAIKNDETPVLLWLKTGPTDVNWTSLAQFSNSDEDDLGTLTINPPEISISSKKYRWTRTGSTINIWVRIQGSFPGYQTTIEFDLPGDIPVPDIWTSQPINSIVTVGSGYISNAESFMGTDGAITRVCLFKDGTGSPIVRINRVDSSDQMNTEAFCFISFDS